MALFESDEELLKMRISVVYPPPKTMCGNISSSSVGALSSATGMAVTRKSPRSLYRERTPTAATDAAFEVIRRTPWNDAGRDSKPGIWLRKKETCPRWRRVRLERRPGS